MKTITIRLAVGVGYVCQLVAENSGVKMESEIKVLGQHDKEAAIRQAKELWGDDCEIKTLPRHVTGM